MESGNGILLQGKQLLGQSSIIVQRAWRKITGEMVRSSAYSSQVQGCTSRRTPGRNQGWLIARPKIVGDGRSLATGSGGSSASSAPGNSPPPRMGTPGSSTMPSVRLKARYGLGLNGKERYRFSCRDNHGRYRIGRKGNSSRRSRTGPRKWDPKVRKFRRTPRKYYRSYKGKGTRKVGSMEKIVGRISNLTRRDRSKDLGGCGNKRSGWNRSRRVVPNRSFDRRVIVGRVANGNK